MTTRYEMTDDDLDAHIAELHEKLDDAEGERTRRLRSAATYKVGDEVQASFDGGRSWHEAIVRSVNVATYREPWYRVSTKRKNGTYAERTREVFVTPRPIETT